MRDERLEPDSPRARFELALELFEFAERMRAQRFRREYPSHSEGDIDALMERWRSERPGAEAGDAPGRPGTWPRRA